MAKKKGKNNSSPLSPERFLKEKAASLPIYKCFISPNTIEGGEAMVVISRKRGNGKICAGFFLVDLWCLGVKDCFGNVNMEVEEFEDRISHNTSSLQPVDYDYAHNLIYGAIEFAEEADINPHPSYRIWQYLLAEDNDDIPFIDIEFGRKGKHFLWSRPGSPEANKIPDLIKKLGDNFDFVLDDAAHSESPDDDDWFDEEELQKEEDDRFHYDYPQYPANLNLKYPFLKDLLLSHGGIISRQDVEKILSLPKDEVEVDIFNIIMWETGRTYKLLNSSSAEPPENAAVILGLLLLAALKSPLAFKAGMEMLHQNSYFIDAHLDVAAVEYLFPALLVNKPDDSQFSEMVGFLNEKGHSSDSYIFMNEILVELELQYPEFKEKIEKAVASQIKEARERIESREWYNHEVPAFLISNTIDLQIKSLLPEIEELFSLGYVDESISGSFNDVKEDLLNSTMPPKTPRNFSLESLIDFICR